MTFAKYQISYTFGKVRSIAIRESLYIKSLRFRIERYQLSWFGHGSTVPQERISKQILYVEESEKRPVG